MSPAARARFSELLAPELKPYLTYSLGVHAAAAFVALRLLGAAGSAGKSAVYTIDFVGGPASVITSAGPSAAAPAATAPPAAAKPAPSGEFDEFGRRKGKKTALPRPSFLRGAQAPKSDEAQPPAPSPGKAPASAETSAAASGVPGDAGAGVSADMPNFPYPWYITRVRQLLWQQWQSRMPRQQGECVVVFSLMPNGSVVDLRTETSSGDAAFDVAALAAVQDAGPYPPLPPQFSEPFLKVHVTLRSQ